MDAPESIRFRLTVHYDGSGFHGWQIQPDQRTVQGELEAALGRLANRPTPVMGSGRTDTGVHATGQVAAADLPAGRWTAGRLQTSLNAVLPPDVWIASTVRTRPDFHPRFDARRRSYRYEVGLRPEAASPFHRRWCWPLTDPVERELLDEAAARLPGSHDFVRFAKAGQPERGTRCTVLAATWAETELGLRFSVTADRYLHHMVRYLVGTMIDVGRGRRSASDFARLLGSDPDLVTSPPAPASGLYLHRVEYPDDAQPSPDPDSIE